MKKPRPESTRAPAPARHLFHKEFDKMDRLEADSK